MSSSRPKLSERLRGRLAAVMRPSLLPAVIAFIVVVTAGYYAERLNQTVFDQQLRAQVLDEVSLIRAKLEGNINGNIQLVRGLVSAVSTEPGMVQQRFAALAENLFREDNQLRNIAGAPDLVVTLMYPLKGNEQAVGLDYRANEAQRADVFRARDTGELVLAGPVDLVQGGRGFIGRFPVFTPAGEGNGRGFWGVISAVMDVDRLYAESGLSNPNLDIDMAIVSSSRSGPFFGSADVLSDDPVSSAIILPSATWHISARPKDGWNQQPANAWPLRLAIIIAGALVVLPILYAGLLINERQRHIRELNFGKEKLQTLSRRLGLALDASRVGVWELDIDRNLLIWDGRMDELYWQPEDDKRRDYLSWRNAIHPDDVERAEAEFEVAMATGLYDSDYRILGPTGEIRHIRAKGAVFRDAGARKILGVNWDVTRDVALNADLQRAKQLTEARNADLEAAKSRIEHNALHDSLTGLPNRRYLDEELTARAAGDAGGLALLHIDLDRFKQINDTLGHAAGDAMLVHAASVLKANVRDGDFVARIGGDEFVVLCSAEGGPEPLAGLAGRIIAEMRKPVYHESHECRFGVSVGIASEPPGAVDPKRLLINADIALYRAKSRGRNRLEFFSDALQAEVVNTKRIADEILSGLERGEFTAFYQPQFDATTLDVVGVEALARWNHPTEGVLGPDVFLAIAEELNVLAGIDRLILERALADRAAWAALGVTVPRISVNVSSRRLHDEDLIKGLRGLDIQPGTVSFELVESIYLDESDAIVAWNIDQIKDLGIDIEIDDFGTGYASIVSLLQLKPTRLKIDRQLIIPITESTGQQHLVASIIEIGHSLGIGVVAEGVETRQHGRLLQSLGCDALQGYAFAKAMDATSLGKFLAANAWRDAS